MFSVQASLRCSFISVSFLAYWKSWSSETTLGVYTSGLATSLAIVSVFSRGARFGGDLGGCCGGGGIDGEWIPNHAKDETYVNKLDPPPAGLSSWRRRLNEEKGFAVAIMIDTECSEIHIGDPAGSSSEKAEATDFHSSSALNSLEAEAAL
ncbi:hypothetical protein Nepgr_010333 [Nepenthes gracilis]|uniref:Uncharacterized protein n=1 Tax=Nepenthes gracilis TaxID=150966 RepID=A0AAD3SC16_NEPGR|nr:hypothetical protein Nepgr_010333 [Nepenthes gracilis]